MTTKSPAMSSEKKILLLVDGSSYLFRAYHALPPLTTSTGQPTGAAYGVLNMLKRALGDYHPDFVGVVFDAKGKTFRSELFEAYKAHRPPMPDELASQIEPLHAMIKATGLPLIVIPGVEADDVIGTLAMQALRAGLTTIVSTGDKDMAQLVQPGITLVNTMTNTTLDRAGVQAKFEVTPEQIVDYLTLVGDSSDNIPGVPKVGPKTAVKWLQAYGSIANLLQHVDEITGKVGENLRAHVEQLPLAQQLATIKLDVPLDFGPTDLRKTEPDQDTLRSWYERMEFKSWLKQISEQSADPNAAAAPTALNTPSPTTSRNSQGRGDYETIFSMAQLENWIQRLKIAPAIAIDLETTSLSYLDAAIVGVSFSDRPGVGAYVPVGHDYPGAPAQLPLVTVLDTLRPLLEDDGLPKVGHNLKYDSHVFANYGIQLAAVDFDTMLESYVFNSTAIGRHDMDSVAEHYLHYQTIHYEDVTGKGAKQIPFSAVDVATASTYAAEDADVTMRLHAHFWPQLSANEQLRKVFRDIEMPLVSVLREMERKGVLIDAPLLRTQSQEIAERVIELEAKAHELAGESFNLGSPKQIQTILFDKLKLPVLQKTPTGQPSTAESVLQELALDYPLPTVILEHRTLSKLKSTYTDKLPEQVHARTGRIHTSYHQAVAATGRLSSSDPNLQNIPIRNDIGRRIRQAFVAPPGFQLLAADYSQIELRIMAHLSEDPRLLAAFQGNDDIHRATAAEIFGTTPQQVTADQRRSAKAINFGLMYGMSAFGLARQLNIDRGAAQEYMDLYFARYPGVKNFMETMRQEARAKGYVETVFGRRLYLPDIQSRNNQRRQAAERAAIDAPMQGTAADIIKIAMICSQAALRKADLGATMIMQVHDELVFEVPVQHVEQVKIIINECMVNAAQLLVPLVVDMGAGANWDEAH